jgi:hypothetical protein
VQDVRSSDDDPDVPTVETYPILVELNGNNRRNHIIADPDTRSVIRARGGADSIRATNGKRDVISCGSGRDRVVADRRDRVGRDCERVTRRVASR